MTDRELEQKLADAFTRVAPDDLEAILSRCGAQNGSVMEMNELKSNPSIIDVEVAEVRPKKKLRTWLAAACAALVLLAGGGGLYYRQSCAVASIVSLDVNPSIELKVNRGERVISCTALNTEAAAVLFDMDGGADLKGTKLDVAVNAIVGALVREGYLDSISSAILISVEDSDQARAQRLQAELVASVDGVLQSQAPGTAVLSQVLTTDAGAEPLVYGEGISLGKSALVQKVLAMNGIGDEAFDQLAALSVEELNDLLKAGEKRIPIGKPAAAVAVANYSGSAAMNSPVTDVDLELERGIYEVELHTAWGDFDYTVDAFTGQVLSGPRDVLNASANTPAAPDPAPEDPATGTAAPQLPSIQQPTVTNPASPSANTQQPTVTNPVSPSANTQDIGEDAAKKAALAHAGLAEGDVTVWKIEREWDNGQLEYEIEFWCGTTEYDYTIHGYTCAVLKHEVDHHREYSSSHSGTGTGTAASTDIGQEAAKAAALAHAGLAEGDVTAWKIEREWDNGQLEYEIEFWCGTTEYDYTIHGYTCAVLKHEVDHHREYSSSYSGTGTGTAASADIGQEAAKAAALTHAGVSESQAARMKVERDWDDGRLEYEVEFRAGGLEYEYTIDGATGAILKYDREWDD